MDIKDIIKLVCDNLKLTSDQITTRSHRSTCYETDARRVFVKLATIDEHRPKYIKRHLNCTTADVCNYLRTYHSLVRHNKPLQQMFDKCFEAYNAHEQVIPNKPHQQHDLSRLY